MQNEMMELMKQFNDNTMATAQRMVDLNTKTVETLSSKQNELFNSCIDSVTKNAESMTTTQDFPSLVEMQKKAVTECSEKLMSNAREAANSLNDTREEMSTIYKEASTLSTSSAEKAAELGKKAIEENIGKVTDFTAKAAAKKA